MSTTPKLEQLDPDLVAKINELCSNKKMTVDQLHQVVGQMGVDVSRATVGRYRQSVREVGKLMAESRGMAAALKSELGDLDDDEQSRLNYEMLQGTLFRILMKQTSSGDDEETQASVKELKQLAEMLHRMAQTRKLDADRVMKVQRAAAEKATDQALSQANDALKANKQPGLSAEMVEKIRKQVLGIAG